MKRTSIALLFALSFTVFAASSQASYSDDPLINPPSHFRCFSTVISAIMRSISKQIDAYSGAAENEEEEASLLTSALISLSSMDNASQEMVPSGFDTLPLELTAHILAYLSGDDLIHATHVSQSFRQAAREAT